MPLWMHNTMEEYLDICDSYLVSSKANQFTHWCGINTTGEILKKAREGDESLVARAEEYIDRFARINYSGEVYKWSPDVLGAFPSIPEYISGSPTPMRNRRRAISDTSPIRVYIGASLNAGCTSSAFFERGIIITSFVMTLQKIRPVELYMWEDSKGPGERTTKPTKNDGAFITLMKLGTYPLNLSQLAYIFSSADFSRYILYQAVAVFDPASTGKTYPNWYIYENTMEAIKDSRYIKWLREYIDAEPHDIFIPSIHTSQIVGDPMDWMTRMLKQTNPELVEET